MVIGAVVTSLLNSPRRTFSFAEQYFFAEWFDAQSAELQLRVRGLVESGQIEFLGGGWSMPDEATPTYVELLDNMGGGQRYIAAHFNESALPAISWQIDPFGHSAFFGVLSSPQGGYTAILWARESAEFKLQSCGLQHLERIWQPSSSLPHIATLQAVFVDSDYSSPDPISRCDYGSQATCGAANAAADVAGLVADVRSARAPNVRGDHFLLNLGSDFTSENFDGTGTGGYADAGNYSGYLDALVDAVNADGQYIAKYSHPSTYVSAKLANAASTFPPVVGDWFPYIQDTSGHRVWSGYFASRPAFKGFVRESSILLQAARQLQVLAGNMAAADGPLSTLERALGVALHHDAISGTATESTNADYSRRLAEGRTALYRESASWLRNVTGYVSAPYTFCPLANVTICPALESGAAVVLAVWNSIGQTVQAQVVRLPVGFRNGTVTWVVTDANGTPITAQLVPLSPRDTALRELYGGDMSYAVQWICFVAPLPAAGYTSFFLVPSADVARSTIQSNITDAGGRDANLTNGRLTIGISGSTGFPSLWSDSGSSLVQQLRQSWRAYVSDNGTTVVNGTKQASGAYIFRPRGTAASPVARWPATVTLASGPVVNLTWHEFGYVSQETRVWKGATSAELAWTVGPINTTDGDGREVILHVESGLRSAGKWATDSNCHEPQLRLRGGRPQWDPSPFNEPVAANYYPVTCLIRATGDNATIALVPDRAQGGSSLADGELELMVHRRLLHDDGCGLSQALNEPGIDGRGLIVRGSTWLSIAPNTEAPRLYHEQQRRSLARPATFVGIASLNGMSPDAWRSAYRTTASLLSKPLPPNVHLASIQALADSILLVRLVQPFAIGEDPTLSSNVTVALAGMFAGRAIVSATDMTLLGSRPLANVPTVTYHADDGRVFTGPTLPDPAIGPDLKIVLGPMEIRTFSVILES